MRGKERNLMSRTNIVLEDKLVKDALRLTKLKTKKAVVNYALAELVRRKKRKQMLKKEGKVKWIGGLEETRNPRL